jgi:hypothetical protein
VIVVLRGTGRRGSSARSTYSRLEVSVPSTLDRADHVGTVSFFRGNDQLIAVLRLHLLDARAPEQRCARSVGGEPGDLQIGMGGLDDGEPLFRVDVHERAATVL